MEAFKIKNGISAKRYLGSTTTLSGSTIDLSLGSMFSTTLSSDPAYTFTNPPASGNAQAFSVEVTGGTTTFTQDSFATTLYTGNGFSQTITNGLDLAGDGGLVWVKWRSGNATPGSNTDHILVDTERGTSVYLESNSTSANKSTAALSSFNSDGFTTSGALVDVDNSGDQYASWSFKKQAKFFDVVTYTGTGSAQSIAHNLGIVPGMIIVKQTNGTRDWPVYHRGIDASNPSHYKIPLNKTEVRANEANIWNDTEPTTTHFTVGSDGETGGNGDTYVAYLFAHDTASDSRIKCGTFTPNGSGEASIDLGWEAQFVIWKRTDALQNWYMVDSQRDIGVLRPNTSDAEVTNFDFWNPTATGFDVLNLTASSPYIYMAIRASAATDSAITWPSSVKWPSGVAPTTPAPGTKDLFTFLTTDGGTTYYGKKAAEGLA